MQVVLGVLLEAMGLGVSDHTGVLAAQLQVWSLLMCGDPRANSPFQGVGGLKSVAGLGLCCWALGAEFWAPGELGPGASVVRVVQCGERNASLG